MPNTLTIRYANPDTTPSRYPSAGWIKADTVVTDGYWTLRGTADQLRAHIEKALADNNLNDYAWRSA